MTDDTTSATNGSDIAAGISRATATQISNGLVGGYDELAEGYRILQRALLTLSEKHLLSEEAARILEPALEASDEKLTHAAQLLQNAAGLIASFRKD